MMGTDGHRTSSISTAVLVVALAATGAFAYGLHQPAPGRERLSDPGTYYVAATGSDAHSCRSPTDACASVARAWRAIVLGADLNGHDAVIQVGPGTFRGIVTDYAGAGGVGPYVGGGAVIIRGTPGQTVLTSDRFTVWMTRSYVRVEDVELRTNGQSWQGALTAAWSGTIEIGPGVRFGPSTGEHIHASSGGQVRAQAGYAIVGGASCHAGAFQGGQVRIMGVTVKLIGSPRWTSAFASTSDAGVFDARNVRYAGAAIGRRFDGGGIFVTDTDNLNAFPGDAPGVLSPGGRYDRVRSSARPE